VIQSSEEEQEEAGVAAGQWAAVAAVPVQVVIVMSVMSRERRVEIVKVGVLGGNK
jgi:hypothetical protein